MIQLRDYQTRFVRETHDALRRVQRVCSVAPTGSGKRLVACWWCTQIAERGRRVAIVTDRRVLIRQAADECKQHGIQYGIVMADEPRQDDAPVQICSIQTFVAREWHDLPVADWWIVDEGHKAGSSYQKLVTLQPAAKFVFLTATPVGANGRTLQGTLVQEIVEPVKNSELLEDGWLLPTRVMTPCEPNVKGVSLSGGEFNQKQLGERVESMLVHANLWKHWEPYSEQQTICFVPRLVFARGLAEQFCQRGHAAEVIEAKTTQRERIDMFERFESGKLRVLVSVDVLREGFDCPVASVGVDLQPNRQFRTYWQKIGRVRRRHGNQEYAVWLDFAGNLWRHIHPDEDPEWPTGEETTQELISKRKEGDNEPEPWQCPKCSYTLSPWERLTDGQCPSCGHKLGKPKRRIIMGDGRLKTVNARQRKKRTTDDKVSVWFRCLYPALHSGRKLNFARYLYKKETGRWPECGELPKCPDRYDSLDWKRRVVDVYPELAKKS